MAMAIAIAVDIGKVDGDCSVEIEWTRHSDGTIEVVGWHKREHEMELKANPAPNLIEAKA